MEYFWVKCLFASTSVKWLKCQKTCTITFINSAKRKEEFKDYCVFTETEAEKVVKHCPTRWLSLSKGIDKTLRMYDALLSYFTSHNTSDDKGRVKRVKDLLASPTTKLYLMFLKTALVPFVEFTTLLQVIYKGV